MNLAQLAALALVLFVSGIGIAALTLVLEALLPRLIRRARTTAEQMPIRSGIVGIVNFAFFALISLAIFSIAQGAEDAGSNGAAGLLRLIGAVIVLFLFAFLALGIAAIARWVGELLAPTGSTQRQALSGIIALELAALAPLVGWILVPLIVMLVGYGAIIIALVWRREA